MKVMQSLPEYLQVAKHKFFLALTFGQYILFENACELQRVVLHLEETQNQFCISVRMRNEPLAHICFAI